MFKRSALAAVAALLVSASAFAAVNFNADTGTGFVGKGDVQLAFGWNNRQAQDNANGVTFSYGITDSYVAVCTFTTGEGTRGEKIHNVDHRTSLSISSAVAYDARMKNQYTGYRLTGFGETVTEGGSVPVVGGACPGNPGTDGVWSSVELTGSAGGLYVTYGSTSVLLPQTPVL